MFLVGLLLIVYVVLCILYVRRTGEVWIDPDGYVERHRDPFSDRDVYGSDPEMRRRLARMRALYAGSYVLLALVGLWLLLKLWQSF